MDCRGEERVHPKGWHQRKCGLAGVWVNTAKCDACPGRDDGDSFVSDILNVTQAKSPDIDRLKALSPNAREKALIVAVQAGLPLSEATALATSIGLKLDADADTAK